MKFLGGLTIFDSIRKAYKPNEKKRFFLFEEFVSPYKLDCTKFLPYDSFFSKLRKATLWTKFNDKQKKVNGPAQQIALEKQRNKSPPPSGFKNESSMKSIWNNSTWLLSKVFNCGITLMMLFPLLKPCKKKDRDLPK